jgi:serine/threonine-protein phosphatase CPPED1
LVDAFPIKRAKLREAQIADLKKTLVELDPRIKLVCICGNHDVGDEPTKETIDEYKKDFGDDYISFW